MRTYPLRTTIELTQPASQVLRRPKRFMLSAALAALIHRLYTGEMLVDPRHSSRGEFQMSIRNKALWAAAILLSAAAAPAPAFAASLTANQTAVIVTPASFFSVEDMNFGSIVPGSAPSTITIDAITGAASVVTGDAALVSGTRSRGRFVGGGEAGQEITLTLSAPPTLTSGGNSMTMADLTLDGPSVRTIGAEQVFDIHVGGTLNIGADQAPGAYTGIFSLTVEYN